MQEGENIREPDDEKDEDYPGATVLLNASVASESMEEEKQELYNTEEQNASVLETLRQIAQDMVTIPIAFILGTANKPRRFLYDRCDGTSDYQDHHRPPCPIFYVPLPVKWFPDLLEQNSLCECFGRVGCVRPYDVGLRKIIFGIATVCQLLAFALTMYAAFAISKDYDILTMTSFTHGTGQIVGGRLYEDYNQPIDVDIGLLGIAVGDPSDLSGYRDRVLRWDDFCHKFSAGFEEFFEIPTCEDCGKTSRSLVASMVMSLLFSIPSFTTDVLRFYPDYDVNCQKFFGSVVSFISMAFSLYTWLSYLEVCVAAFYDNEIGMYTNRTVEYDLDKADIIVKMNWEAGWGYRCIFTATVLKIVDVICNLAVPTPRICRDHAEQAMYEIIAINRDVHIRDATHYTSESLRDLQQSVRMAKAKLSSSQLVQGDPSETSARMEDNPGSFRINTQLSTVEEGSSMLESTEGPTRRHDDGSLPSPEAPDRNNIRGASEPVIHLSNETESELNVPHVPTPSPLRMTKSVYF